MQTDTSGGSSETDVNELAASPTGASSIRAAMAVTPVGKAPNTRRSSAARAVADRVPVMPAPSAPSMIPRTLLTLLRY
jgi:hypothetical protein